MDPIGSVVQANGPVYAVSDGGMRPLSAGDPVYEGETLTTGENANVEIRFSDDSVLAQGPNSALTIDQYAFDADEPAACRELLHVDAGTYRLVTGEIGEANPEAVAIKTPLANVGVRGTGIDVMVHQDWVKVGVFSYHNFDVVITTAQGTTFLTDGNQLIEIFADGSFSDPLPFSDLDQFEIAAMAPISPRSLGHERGGFQDPHHGDEDQDDDAEARGDADDDRPDNQNQDDPESGQNPGHVTSRALLLGDPLGGGQGPLANGGPAPRNQAPGQGPGLRPDQDFDQDLGPDGDHEIYDEDDHPRPGDEPQGGDTGAGDDHLVGDDQDNLLNGRGGDDTLSGGPGDDTLMGGDGEDWYEADNPSETPSAGGVAVNLELGEAWDQWGGQDDISGIEHVLGGAGDDSAIGDEQDNMLLGRGGNDRLEGKGGEDTLMGGQGRDYMDGGQGHDWLEGGQGIDTFMGGQGDDTIADYEPGEIADGGDGYDLIRTTGGNLSLTKVSGVEEIDLTRGDSTLTVAEGDILNAGNDTLTITGDAGDSLYVADGNWRYQGGEDGYDIFTSEGGATIQVDEDLGGLEFGHTPQGLVIEGTPDQDSLAGTPFDDTIKGLADDDSLMGGRGADSIDGSAGHDTLLGETGDDTLLGGAGDDCLVGGQGTDSFAGGDGDDTIADFEPGETADGGEGYDLLISTGGDLGLANVANVEEIDLTRGDATLTVHQDDVLNSGDDTMTITGDAGDSLYVADGDWHYQGGEDGYDIFSSDGGATIQVDTDLNDVDFQNGVKGFDTAGTPNQDTLTGSRFDDTIRGLAGDDSLVGGLGDDSLVGGEGTDTFMGGAGDDTIADFELGETADGGDGHDVLMSKGGDFDLQHVKNVEEIDLTQGDSTLTVNQDDILNAGDDTLTITGDRYGDSLYVADGQWEYQGSEGGYKTFCSDGGATLKVNDDLYRMDFQNGVKGLFITGTPDMETLEGSAYNDTLVGLAGNDSLFSVQGDDSLVGGQGVDFFIGGEGDDTIADFELGETADGGDGYDLIRTTGGNLELSKVSGVEEVDLTPGDTSLTVAEGDILNADNDTLTITGDAGDSLHVSDGNWRYQGGEDGYDIFTSDGGATIQVDEDLGGLEFAHTPQGLVIEGAPGQDNLLGTPFDDTIKGLADNDTLAGGLGADSIDGGAGQDTLLGETGDDTLLGGAGNDSLMGGEGQDNFDGGAGDDTIADFNAFEYVDGGEGNDLLRVAAGETQSFNLDRVTGVEEVDLAPGQATLRLTQADVLATSDTGVLTVRGGADDCLNITDGQWVYRGENADGLDVYESGGATLKVDPNLGHVNFTNTPTGRFVGTENADTLQGSKYGYDDTVTGLGGDDCLMGGDGDDLIQGDSGPGFLTTNEIGGLSVNYTVLQLVDMDGDGDLDVLAPAYRYDTIHWFENDGQGVFSGPHEIITAHEQYNVEAGDLDGDGLVDIAHVYFNRGEVSWLKANGDGTYEEFKLGDLSSARFVGVADLDGDGDLDVIASGNQSSIVWYENQGNGSFGPEHTIAATAKSHFEVFDLDGDGDLDLLVGNTKSPELTWRENNGHGDFSAAKTIDADPGHVEALCAADLNGDGRLDVISGCWDEGVVNWYENLGEGKFGAANTIGGLPTVTDVCAADVDGDGHMDIIVSSGGKYQILYLKNDGQGGFSKWHTVDTPAPHLEVGDVDGDGLDDVVWTANLDPIFWNKYTNTDGHDTLLGEAGNDTLLGGAGDDCLIGGQDMDSFAGGAGDDTIADFEPGEHAHGGEGNDLLSVAAGETQSFNLDRVTGVEEIDLAPGQATLRLTQADVLATSDTGVLTVRGGADDCLNITDGQWVYKGENADGLDVYESGGATLKVDPNLGHVNFTNTPTMLITGTENADTLQGSKYGYDDTITGLGGNDTLLGEAGNDTLDGGAGYDLLFGGQDDDSLMGGDGNDTIAVEDGQDTIDGGDGTDLLFNDSEQGWTFTLGENGNGSFKHAGQTHTYENMEGLIGTDADDALTGNSGDNVLMGRGGADTLDGGAGDDSLFGGDGSDKLFGGVGADTLDGGAGADRYYYTARGQGGDTILHFEHGQDHLCFDSDAFTVSGPLFKADDFGDQGYDGANADVGDASVFIFDTTSGEVWYDDNGDADGGQELIATIEDGDLSISDFLLT